MKVRPDPVSGLPQAEPDAAWTVEQGLLWLAEHRALLRVLRTDDGEAQILVTVRPQSHPGDVLAVRRACPGDAPLLAIAAALEEAACALLADEARRTLRLVTDGAAGPMTDTPPPASAGGPA